MRNFIFFTLLMSVFSAVCRAQVPVSQEPMHHKVLDNGHVRLLDVHIPPGDTTQFHIHATPSVFLLLTAAHTGADVISEEDRLKFPVPDYGNIWFEGFYKKPRVHRVFNLDSHEFHVMDIELTNKDFIVLDSPIKKAGFTFLFEEKPVRAYRLKMDGGTGSSLVPRKGDLLIILLTDSSGKILVNGKSFHLKGDFLYIPSGSSLEISNQGMLRAEFALFELK